jgi:hypothetical protein
MVAIGFFLFIYIRRFTMLKHDLIEYFKYHPVTTTERQAAHDVVNATAFALCEQLWSLIDASDNMYSNQYLSDGLKLKNVSCAVIRGQFKDAVCHFWMEESMGRLEKAIYQLEKTSVLMCVQQIRMFANQGITLDSLD